jgi:cellulose synthase/poly-beta-1,6-N-acetylglucosamine synthase-like glycosyltransferase
MGSVLALISIVFWTSAAAVFYAYVGYPVVIHCLSRWFGREPQPPQRTDDELPSVSLLIAAHNEQAVISDRLHNALAADYPPHKLQVVVACDGCTDATATIVQSFVHSRVRLLNYPDRRGKAAVLNDSIKQLDSQIVILSDANTSFEPAALRNLVRWFADHGVGAVCGRLVLTDPHTGRNADSLYWKYETFLKRRESRLGALLGANGAIYAVRRDLYIPIPDGTIVDDFVVPLLARVKTHCSIIYDHQAVAQEQTPPDVASEFRRRSRIGAGDFQSLSTLWRLLLPRNGWIAFTFLSHKILRWFCPFFLIGLFICNLFLLDRALYQYALLAQGIWLLASLASCIVPAGFRPLKPLRLTLMFTSMNLALLVGFCRWMRGNQTGVWQRTARAA